MTKTSVASILSCALPTLHAAFIERHGRVIREHNKFGGHTQHWRRHYRAMDRSWEKRTDKRNSRLVEVEAVRDAQDYMGERRQEQRLAARTPRQALPSTLQACFHRFAVEDRIECRLDQILERGFEHLYMGPARAYIDVPVTIRRSRAASARAAMEAMAVTF
jgi:hypothetical protein